MDHCNRTRIFGNCEAQFMTFDPGDPRIPPTSKTFHGTSETRGRLTSTELEGSTFPSLGGIRGDQEDKDKDNGGLCCTPPAIPPIPHPGTWATLCISTYRDDLAAMDQAVAYCKQSGMPGMSRSKLIRIALRRLDLEQVIAELRGVR